MASPVDTTGRVRRNAPATDPLRVRFEPRGIIPAVPVPAVQPRPFGELAQASIGEVSELAATVWAKVSPTGAADRRRGVRLLLEHLATFTGDTWQQRWEASGLDEGGRPVGELAGGDQRLGRTFQRGQRALMCLRVIRPSLPAFYTTRMIAYSENFRATQDDPLLDRFFEHVEASGETHRDRLMAKADVATALTVFGITLHDLDPPALLHFALESRMVPRSGGAPPDYWEFGGRAAWRLLHSMGHFPASTPSTVREAVIRGQLTVSELVSRYGIRNQHIRDLLIEYLNQRAVALDYSSVVSLTQILADLFWCTVERINPDQRDLRLNEATYQQWKATIESRKDGTPRKNTGSVLVAVRSFYLDLQSWAHAEPERWAQWAAPCPVRDVEFRRTAQEQRRASERVAERIRQRQPLLGQLLDHAEERHQHLTALLTAASSVEPGHEFTHTGHRYRRTNSRVDQHRNRKEGKMPVRVEDLDNGKAFDVAIREELAFWEWAVIATLRHSGVRVEELCELTHLSLRQYQRPSGEVVALLVIAPSKSDRERVIPMSTELFATLAAVVRRQLSDQDAIPPVRRYDVHEKVWSDPLPHLFQRKIGIRRAVLSIRTIHRMIARLCRELATVHPAFAELTFTPHDFRRLFATEIVNNGLPIHIGAALLGHLDTRTTRGYVAVFNEDLVRHYQSFLDRRRSQRAADEYRPATDEEWTEFEEHFDKRKVELGNCARPYGTPCQHEHACIRCPMLHVDPKMIPRLDELESDLLARRAHAESQGWLGEIEGIDLTLSFLRNKRARARRLTTPTHLGLPHPRPAP